MTSIIKTDPLFNIREIRTESDLDLLKQQINPDTQCLCISSYARLTKVIRLGSESDEDAESLGLMVGVFEETLCTADTYRIFVVPEPFHEMAIECICSSNIRIVTYDAVTGHPNSATDGHLNDASKHERFSLGRPRLVMCL